MYFWPYSVVQPIPTLVLNSLKTASQAPVRRKFACRVFNSEWDHFVEEWAPRVYAFVEDALGPYGTTPLPEIHPLSDGDHSAGATAAFNMGSGQVYLCTSVEGRPGQTLEKLTHEFLHGALSKFPSEDDFYTEGYVDYSVWVLAHAPVWGQHRDAMIEAAAYNITQRRERAMLNQVDYDRKRWAGGLYAMVAYGPWIISALKQKKSVEDFTW